MFSRPFAARVVLLATLAAAIACVVLAGCGVSVWFGSKPPIQYVYLADASTTHEPPTPSPSRFGGVYDAGWQTGNGTFYLTTCNNVDGGTPTTVTVPTGSYVTMLTATAGGSGGTITITPAGPLITDAQINPPIVLGSNQPFTLGKPVLTGNPNEMGVGTTITFSAGIAQCMCALQYYGGP